MSEYFKVINYEEALCLLKSAMPIRAAVEASLVLAAGRRLSKPVVSPENLPAFNRSSVDGYAVKAADTHGASESYPAMLEVVGEIQMGEEAGIQLAGGHCVWVPTGGMLPPGSDAVVMVEYTEKLDEITVMISRAAATGENLMLAGEDVCKEQHILSQGHVVRPVDIGLMAALGFDRIMVDKPYTIGIVSTGDELVPVEARPRVGQIRDVNSVALASACASIGEIAEVYPLVKDEPDELERTIRQALQENDLVLLSGGSSVGVKDMSLRVLQNLGNAELLFHGLAVKPGKPSLAVQADEGLVIGLPGHPVSALMIFYILCQPAMSCCNRHAGQGVLVENLASQAGRDDFVPVRFGGGATIVPLLGKSGLMSILSGADGYIHIPRAEQGLLKGSVVDVYTFSPCPQNDLPTPCSL